MLTKHRGLSKTVGYFRKGPEFDLRGCRGLKDDEINEQLDVKDKMVTNLQRKMKISKTKLIPYWIYCTAAMIVVVMVITANVTIWKEMMFNYLLLLTRMPTVTSTFSGTMCTPT